MAEKSDLVERIEYLEAQNEGLKRVGLLGLILVFILGGIVVYQSYADLNNVTTRGIVMMEGSRLHTSLFPQGEAHLALVPFNANEQLPNIDSKALEGLRGLAVYDTKGKARIAIGVDGLDNPILMIFGPDGSISYSALPPPDQQAAPTGEATPAPTPAATATPK